MTPTPRQAAAVAVAAFLLTFALLVDACSGPEDVEAVAVSSVARPPMLELDRQLESTTTSTSTTSTTASTTTSTTASTTTSTIVARAPEPEAPTSAAGTGGLELRSTAYCLTGKMASGRPTYVGAVAANRFPLGTVLEVSPSPWGSGPRRFVVEDRHRDGATELDFAMPGECGRALEWGNRRYVSVRVVR